MQAPELPNPGYSIKQAETILNAYGKPTSEKYIYRLIRRGRISAYLDETGAMRVSKEELYRVLSETAS